MFRHIVQKYSAIHKVLPAFFEQSDENSDGAIYAPGIMRCCLNIEYGISNICAAAMWAVGRGGAARQSENLRLKNEKLKIDVRLRRGWIFCQCNMVPPRQCGPGACHLYNVIWLIHVR